MANGKYYPPRKFMPGAPLPSLQARAVDSRSFDLQRGQEFTKYLDVFASDTPNVAGDRGFHINRTQSNDSDPIAYMLEIAGKSVGSLEADGGKLSLVVNDSNQAAYRPFQLAYSSGMQIGFYGAAPVSQPAGSSDVLGSLVTLGLRGASSNPPLNLGTGALTAGASALGATTLSGNLTLSAHNIVTDTSTGTQIGTGSTQKLGFFGAAAAAQPDGTTDILAGLITLGLRGNNVNASLDCGTGTIQALVLASTGSAFFTTALIGTGGISGNTSQSTMLRLGFATANFGSQADKTLNTAQYAASILKVTSGFGMAAPQNCIFPVQTGAFVIMNNATTGGQSIGIIGATGTGIMVANGKTALAYCDGTNWLRATPDT